MLLVWVLLFIIGKAINASALYWVIFGIGCVWSAFKHMMDNAPEMEE